MAANYDLIVLGGGSAGLTAAVMSAGFGDPQAFKRAASAARIPFPDCA